MMNRSRRQFLQYAAFSGAIATIPGCGWKLADIQNQTPIASNSDELNLYTWTSYTDEPLLQGFQSETGIKGRTEIMASNEEMIAAFEAGKGREFSILCPSDYAVGQMQAKNYLQALDESRLEDLSTLLPNLAKVGVIDGKRYSVPLTWGTTGLLYNRKKLPQGIADLGDLWTNKDRLTRKMTLLDDPREVFGLALHQLGFSQNTSDRVQIQQAYDRLQALKPHLASFTTDAWRDPLVAGDIWIAMAYSTDATDLIKENPDIQYLIPPSGTNLWVDTMVIPVTAPNPQLAYTWMNYVLNPDRADGITQRLGYVPTTQASIDRLSTALRQDPIRFPSSAILAKCETMQTLSEEATALVEKLWTQLKS
jgi:spermidine/putrescine transport system substrate-binding protein